MPTPTKLPNWAGSGAGAIATFPARPRLHCRPWTALAVEDTIARLIADVYVGKLSPRIAAGLAPLLNLQMRAIEARTDMERRIAELEKLLAEGAEDAPKTTA